MPRTALPSPIGRRPQLSTVRRRGLGGGARGLLRPLQPQHQLDQLFLAQTLKLATTHPTLESAKTASLKGVGKCATWPALAPFIAGHPDDKRITAHWDDVLRLAASVRTGVISASLMLKRLGAYPRQNGLALALREIGRIERTLYTLDWLEHPSLRRQATAELNKGESRNALARAVCFHRLGRLRDRTAEAQQHRASG